MATKGEVSLFALSPNTDGEYAAAVTSEHHLSHDEECRRVLLGLVWPLEDRHLVGDQVIPLFSRVVFGRESNVLEMAESGEWIELARSCDSEEIASQLRRELGRRGVTGIDFRGNEYLLDRLEIAGPPALKWPVLLYDLNVTCADLGSVDMRIAEIRFLGDHALIAAERVSDDRYRNELSVAFEDFTLGVEVDVYFLPLERRG